MDPAELVPWPGPEPPAGKTPVRAWCCPVPECWVASESRLLVDVHLDEDHPVESAEGAAPVEGVMWLKNSS